VVKDWIAMKIIRLIEHSPSLPDFAPTDFMFFLTTKKELAGKTQDNFKTLWERLPEAFWWRFQWCDNIVHVCSAYMGKSGKLHS
jgi:hypothetical protein